MLMSREAWRPRLSALAHILQPRIKVQRAYEPVPLLVNTVGTELNQVWTNIIENAVDAMQGGVNFGVRTFREDSLCCG